MRLFAAFIAICLLAGQGESASITYKSGLRRELCEWGSQYWCASPKTATLCDKTEWCTKYRWQDPMLSEPECKTVQDLIKHVKLALAASEEKPTSEYEVATFIARGCLMLQDESSKMQCKTIVTNHEYLPKLVELIDSKLPVLSVAEAVGICKRMQLKEASKVNEEQVEELGCITCEDVVTVTQKHARSHLSLDMYKKMVRSQCDKLGSASKECHDMAMKKYKEFYRRFVGVNPSTVCEAQKQCVSKKGRLSPAQAKSEVCATCEMVIQDIRTMDRDANVQAAIKGLINETCKYLGEFEELCTAMVNEGLEYVFEIIATELQPEVICERLNLCAGDTEKAIEQPVIKEKVSLTGVKCTVCEFMMREVDKMLLSNKTEEAILNILDQVCTRLPPSIAQECEALLDQYKPSIIKILAAELDPEKVCTLLGVCTQKLQAAATKEKQSDDKDCAICEFVVKVIDDVLMANETEDALEKLLDNICDRLPRNVRRECDRFVGIYSPQLLALIVSNMRAEQICILLKLCPAIPNNVALKFEPKNPVKEDDVLCELCEYLVSYIDQYLQKNSTEEEIEQFLDQICTRLPAEMTNVCENLVKQYAPTLIRLLVSGIDPAVACKSVGLCNNQMAPKEGVDSDVACAVCEMVMHQLDSLIGAKATAAEAQSALDRVCGLVPKSVQGKCIAFVNEYTPFILQVIAAEISPKEVCGLLKLCPNSKPVLAQTVNKQVKDDECTVCKLAVSALDSLLEANATKEDVAAALEKVCSFLPEGLRPQCNAFVSEYASYVVDIIASDLKPDQVCQKLGLCSSEKEVGPVPRQINEKVGAEICDVCLMTLTLLEDLLPQNATEEVIIQTLRTEVCERLPAQMKEQCKSMVEIYLHYVVDLIIQELPPQKICSTIGLCSKSQVAASSIAKKPRVMAPLKDGPQCTICEFVMTELDNTLANNATQQQIEQALEQVCNFLPASVKGECDSFVTQYTPQLIQMLVKLKPAQVCSYLGLCVSSLKKVSSPVKAGPQCTICEFIMTELDNTLAANATQQQVEQALEQVCNFLPASVKQPCDEFVTQYTSQLIQILVKLKPAQVCTYLGFCNGTQLKNSKLTESAPLKDGPQCTICEFVMTELDNILANNATQQQIEQALEQVCNFLPASVKDQCDSFVTQYTPQLIQMLVKLKPAQVCSYLKLCVGTLKIKAGPQCILCEFIMSQLDQVLAENATEQQIEQALDTVCNILPTSVKAQCEDFVHQYTPKLIQALLKFKPQEVCTRLGLCNSTKLEVKRPENAGPKCTICELIMTEMKTALSKNSSKAEITKALDQVCNFLPASVKQECDSFVQQYAPQIIQLLLQVQPDQVCSFLGLCSNKFPVTKSSPVKFGPTCVLCEFILKELEKMLNKNATEQEIEQALDKVCNFLPASIKEECDAFVKQYTSMIIQLLLQMAPGQVCTYMGVCSTQLKINTVNAGPSCVLCEFVMTELEKILAANATQQQIQQALDQVCNLLPSTLKQQCDDFVKQYTPTLIQLLLQVTPDKACTFLKLCTSNNADLKEVQGKIKEAVQCTLCKIVMDELEKMLGENATQAQIEQALESVCDALPVEIRPECHQFMAEYIPRLIEILLTYKPADVCTTLAICTKKKSAVSAVAGAVCVVCEAVMKEFESLVGTPVTKDKIQAFIDQACSLVPSNLKDQCDQLVVTFTPQILDLLLEINPNQWCSAVQICQSSSFLAFKKVKSGPQCTICEFAMSKLDQILADNATEQQIEQALGKVCSLLPANVQPECNAFVKQYTPELINLLLQYKPEQVCTYLGLCSAGMSIPKKVQAGPQCIICEFVMSELDQILANNATEQQIAQALDKVCSLLPVSIKAECDAFVTQYTPELIKLLVQYKPQQVCTYLNLCSSFASVSNMQVRGDYCPVCELAMTQLDEILADNSTKEQIEQALSEVCNLLPSDKQSQCNAFVKQYFDELVLIILQYQPHQICALLGLCPSANQATVVSKPNIGCIICDFVMVQLDEMMTENTTQEKIREVLDHACTAFPHEEWKTECTEFVDKYTEEIIELLLLLKPEDVCIKLKLCPEKKATVQTKRVTDGPQCALCEFVLKQLDTMLADNATQAQIEAALEQVCNFLPASIKNQCDGLVEQYTHQLIQLLLTFKPQQVCTRLKLCTNTSRVVTRKVTGGSQCSLCEFVVSKLDDMLSDNATQAQIEVALELVCNFLPASVKDQCDTLIEKYTPQLIQLLLNFKPQQVCTRLKLCTNTSTILFKKVTDGPQCALCEFVVSKLEDMLSDNATQAQIEAALEQVCNVLPASIKDQCDDLLEQYTPQLIQLLLNVKPQQVCTRLKLCTNTSTVFTHKVTDGPQCALCEFVVSQLDKMLSDNATQAQIEAALEQVCNFLPASIKNQCDDLIKQYTPQLIQLLLTFKPQQVCTRLELCTNTSRAQVSKVSDGPQCTICEFVMTELDNILADNATQAQIIAALEQVCNFLPASVKGECDTLVQQYTPQLIVMLLQYKPEEICTRLKLCPSKTQAEPKSNGPLCIICEFVILELDNLLAENATQAQIELALDIVCNLLPESMKHDCGILVAQHAPQLVQLLLHFKPQEVCTRLNLCTPSGLVDTSAKCYLCEFIMAELENLITSTSGEAEIEEALKKVCILMPPALVENCRYAVEDFTPTLLNVLLNKASPDTVCVLINVCPAPTDFIPVAEESPVSNGSDLCEFCEYVIQYLDNVLEENITREDIETAIHKLCSFVPANLKDFCDKFLEEQAETLIDELEKTLDPKGLCKSAGLCNDHSPKVLDVLTLPQVEAYEFCEFCERLIPELDNLLQQDFTKEAIEAALHEVCKVFDDKALESCEKFVTQYTPLLIELMVTISPDQICETLKLCPVPTTPTPAIKQSNSLMFVPESDHHTKDLTALDRPIVYHPYCSNCKFLMYYLQTSISDSFWENTAKNSLYEFCHQIKYEQDVCKILMDMNADHILGTVRGFRFPETFCQSTDMCEPPFNDDDLSKHSYAKELMQPQAADDDFPHCDSCKFLASNLNQVASQPYWQAQLRTSLDETCDLMSYGKDVCKRLIEENIQFIVNNVSSSGWPDHICQAINLCRIPSKKVLSSGEIACQLCGKISETAKIFLKTGSSSKRVFEYLEMACNTNSDAVEKDRCLTIVRQYAPELLETLKTEDPKKACKTMNLCFNH